MDSLERIALWAVVIVCVALLRLLIRAARRKGGKMPPPQPGVPMAPKPSQRTVSGATVPAPPSIPPPIAAPPVAKQATTAQFEIVGLSGEYAGQRLRPGATELVFGRDAALAHVVYPANLSAISKRHCRIFSNSVGRIWIEDTWSSNGTFLAELKPGAPAATTRLDPGIPREIQPGESFCLAGPAQMFRVEKKA